MPARIGFSDFEKRLYYGLATCEKCGVFYRLHDHLMGDVFCRACCAALDVAANVICYHDEIEGETFCREYTPLVARSYSPVADSDNCPF